MTKMKAIISPQWYGHGYRCVYTVTNNSQSKLNKVNERKSPHFLEGISKRWLRIMQRKSCSTFLSLFFRELWSSFLRFPISFFCHKNRKNLKEGGIVKKSLFYLTKITGFICWRRECDASQLQNKGFYKKTTIHYFCTYPDNILTLFFMECTVSNIIFWDIQVPAQGSQDL